ncbi:MAG: glycosyltransferase family 87 protein [Crocinitomicaceae bacterium]
MKAQLPKYLTGIIFLISIVILQWISRDDFWILSSVYLTSFIAYLLLVFQFKSDSRFLIFVTIVSVLSFFCSTPQMSEDVYRFLWDGKLWHLEINPYNLPPSEVVSNNGYLAELYPKMTELTKGNHTCYPGFNQLYFFIAAFTSSVSHSIVILKVLFVVSIVPGLIVLQKLLRETFTHSASIWLLILNPLFLIESFGNLHFEAVMMGFLIIAFYYLKRTLWLSAIFLALAVQIKLLPLIVLPFLIRYIGWQRALFYGAVVLTINVLISVMIMTSDEALNFLQSLRLYFGIFEFNSFIPHYLQEFVQLFTGFDPIRYTAPILSALTIVVLLYLGFYRKKKSLPHLIRDLSIGFLIYFLLNSTVHPWYLITLIFFLPFVQRRTIILWSLVGFLSYGFYSLDPTTARILINVEYLIILISLGLELRAMKVNRVNDHVS